MQVKDLSIQGDAVGETGNVLLNNYEDSLVSTLQISKAAKSHVVDGIVMNVEDHGNLSSRSEFKGENENQRKGSTGQGGYQLDNGQIRNQPKNQQVPNTSKSSGSRTRDAAISGHDSPAERSEALLVNEKAKMDVEINNKYSSTFAKATSKINLKGNQQISIFPNTGKSNQLRKGYGTLDRGFE